MSQKGGNIKSLKTANNKKMQSEINQLKNQLKKKNNNNQQGTKKRSRRKRPGRKNGSGFSGTSSRDVPFSSNTGDQMLSNKMSCKVVPYREYLQPVTSSIGFASTKYSWNPGVSSTFPWLAKEAAQWEKYQFIDATLIYTPQVTEFSTNGIGSLVLSFDSNASDFPPQDIQHALDIQPRSFNLPCKSIAMKIPNKIMNTLTDGFFVRSSANIGGDDIKTYDCGNLFVSTQSQATNGATLGLLCVQYTVKFFIPVLESTVPYIIPSRVYYATNTDQAGPENTDTIINWDTQYVNGLGVVNNAGSLIFPAGNYFCVFSVTVESADVGDFVDTIALELRRGGIQIYLNSAVGFEGSGVTDGTILTTLTCPIMFQVNGTDVITAVLNGGSVSTNGVQFTGNFMALAI